jgi:hypothetical protein
VTITQAGYHINHPHKEPSLQSSGFEHKLLNAGNFKQAQTEITGLEPLKLSIQ